MPKMNITDSITDSYSNNMELLTMRKQSQTKPILPAYMVGKIALSLSKGLLKLPRVQKPASKSPERFMEAQGAYCKNCYAHNEQDKYLRPENFYADAFEKHTPENNYEIPEGIKDGYKLDEPRHILNGKNKAGKQISRQKEQEC